MELGVKSLGPDGTLIAVGKLTTIKMQQVDEPPKSANYGEIRVWENGNFVAQVSKERAQEILCERQGDDISIF